MLANVASSMPQIARHTGAHALSAPGVSALRFSDAEEQACALTGWNQDYLQLSAGAFQGDICQLSGTGIKLFVEQVQQSVFQTGLLPSDVLAVGIPLDASGSGMFCGKACGADDLHVFSGLSGFEFRTSRQHTMLGIELQLSQGCLNDGASRPDQGHSAAAPLRACAMQMTPVAFAELKTYLLTLFQSAQSRPYLLSNPALVATVADFLLDRIAQVSRQHGSERSGATCSHWGLVQQACALLQDKPDQAPTVAQLCLDLGVSRRTLQNGFQRVLHVSPLAYLKAVRLDRARRALKQVGSVTEAATAFGFWHFGHFAQDYQSLFGERPSDTLRRHSSR